MRRWTDQIRSETKVYGIYLGLSILLVSAHTLLIKLGYYKSILVLERALDAGLGLGEPLSTREKSWLGNLVGHALIVSAGLWLFLAIVFHPFARTVDLTPQGILSHFSPRDWLDRVRSTYWPFIPQAGVIIFAVYLGGLSLAQIFRVEDPSFEFLSQWISSYVMQEVHPQNLEFLSRADIESLRLLNEMVRGLLKIVLAFLYLKGVVEPVVAWCLEVIWPVHHNHSEPVQIEKQAS